MMKTDRVQIIMPSGKEFTIDEGPFILWDGCEAATNSPIIDVSGESVYYIITCNPVPSHYDSGMLFTQLPYWSDSSKRCSTAIATVQDKVIPVH